MVLYKILLFSGECGTVKYCCHSNLGEVVLLIICYVLLLLFKANLVGRMQTSFGQLPTKEIKETINHDL